MSEVKLNAEQQIIKMQEKLKAKGFDENGYKIQSPVDTNSTEKLSSTQQTSEVDETVHKVEDQKIPVANIDNSESEVHKKARELGWKSKEERISEGKNNDFYIEPEEYIRRQPLFEKIDRQNKEIRELRDLMRQTTEHVAAIKTDSYAQTLRQLEARESQAVSEGDQQTYQHVKTELQTLQQKIASDSALQIKQEQATQTSPKLPEVESWKFKNAHWYNTNTPENTEMLNIATFIDKFYANRAVQTGQTLNPVEHLNSIETEVRRLFPHRFPNEKKSPAMSVGKSTTSANNNSEGNDLINQLTPAQLELGKHFQKVNPKYTLKDYALDLKKRNRLGK